MACFDPTQQKYNADVHSIYTKLQISTIQTEQMMAILLYGLKLVSWRGLNGNFPYVHRFGSNVECRFIPYCTHASKAPEPKIGVGDP